VVRLVGAAQGPAHAPAGQRVGQAAEAGQQARLVDRLHEQAAARREPGREGPQQPGRVGYVLQHVPQRDEPEPAVQRARHGERVALRDVRARVRGGGLPGARRVELDAGQACARQPAGRVLQEAARAAADVEHGRRARADAREQVVPARDVERAVGEVGIGRERRARAAQLGVAAPGAAARAGEQGEVAGVRRRLHRAGAGRAARAAQGGGQHLVSGHRATSTGRRRRARSAR